MKIKLNYLHKIQLKYLQINKKLFIIILIYMEPDRKMINNN